MSKFRGMPFNTSPRIVRRKFVSAAQNIAHSTTILMDHPASPLVATLILLGGLMLMLAISGFSF